jgi:hypothetical protein
MKTQKKDLTTAAYEKGIQDYLKEVAESGSDVHENYTPAEICDMMLDKVDLAKAETVLVLYNIELLFALKKRKFSGHVTFFTQSEVKAGLAPKIFSNITVEYIDKEANPLYHMENKWPDKFDIVIANPPYGSGTKKLDIKFLDKALDICDGEVVFVHPASQYVDGKGQNNLYNNINKKIRPRLKSIHFFNGNYTFGNDVAFFVPCTITHITSIKNSDENFTFINEINGQKIILDKENSTKLSNFGYRKIFLSFKEKIELLTKEDKNLKSIATVLGFSGDQSSKMILKNPNSFLVQFTHIRGGVSRERNKLHNIDFYTLFKKDKIVESGINPKNRIWFEFSTEMEANNFVKFCKTNFVRACISLVKTNANIAQNELAYIPLVDFTQEWTDKKLYAYFNITEEEQAFIKEVIPPYYD